MLLPYYGETESNIRSSLNSSHWCRGLREQSDPSIYSFLGIWGDINRTGLRDLAILKMSEKCPVVFIVNPNICRSVGPGFRCDLKVAWCKIPRRLMMRIHGVKPSRIDLSWEFLLLSIHH